MYISEYQNIATSIEQWRFEIDIPQGYTVEDADNERSMATGPYRRSRTKYTVDQEPSCANQEIRSEGRLKLHGVQSKVKLLLLEVSGPLGFGQNLHLHIALNLMKSLFLAGRWVRSTNHSLGHLRGP